jgi:hypothetical protein
MKREEIEDQQRTINALEERMTIMMERLTMVEEEMRQMKGKFAREFPTAGDAERITLSEKTEKTETTERIVTLPRGTKFTHAQAINMMQLAGAKPMGVEGSHEVDEYIVEKLLREVKFPQPGTTKDERVKKTARILESVTKMMLDTHKGTRNMVLASDLGYRIVYVYVTVEAGNESRGMLDTKSLRDAILASYSLSVEAICDYISTTKKGREWEKLAETLEKTFKENEGQIVSMSKDEFERILQSLYKDVPDCLTSTALWRKEDARQQRRRAAAVGVLPV